MNNYNPAEELMHYGVKGMKWGVRRKRYADSEAASNMRKAKSEFKTANREYNKSFNYAYNRAGQAYSLSKKRRAANTARWEDVADKAKKRAEAKSAYKDARKAYKQEVKAERNSQKEKRKPEFVSEYQKERDRQKRYLATKRSINLGTRFANSYLSSHNVTLNNSPVRVSSGVVAIVNTMLNYKYAKNTLK